MPRRLVKKVAHLNNWNIWIVYSAVLLLIFAAYITYYINSSYLKQFIPNESIGLIYTIEAALTILSFLFISRVLRRVGNYRATIGLVITDIFAVLGLASADTLRVAVPLFMIHLICITLTFFNFDIFIEEAIGNKEGETGSRRGLLLALSSFVGAVTPLLAGYLVGDDNNFTLVYITSAIALLPVLALVTIQFRKIKQPHNHEIKVLRAIRSFWVQRDIRFVFLCNLLLWFFFSFAVVYIPLYLSSEMHFSWTLIGIMLFAAQLAYVFLEYPIGVIADSYLGEKEMMITGFLILSSSVASLSLLNETTVWTWIILMFITRVGASLIEVTTESYFFKHTRGSDGQIISFFRMANPTAYIAGPLVASLTLLYLPFNFMFVVFGLCLLPGALLASFLKDTK